MKNNMVNKGLQTKSIHAGESPETQNKASAPNTHLSPKNCSEPSEPASCKPSSTGRESMQPLISQTNTSPRQGATLKDRSLDSASSDMDG